MTRMPSVIVDVGFTAGPTTGTALHLDDSVRGLLNTGTLGADDILTDVTAYVHQFSTSRGSNRVEGPVVRYEAGQSSTVLNNSDRRFDPTNLAGPYVAGGVTQVTPMRIIRHRATWNGITYSLWRGFADSWLLSYNKADYSSVTVAATDGFKVLESYDRAESAPVGGSEDSGARVSRILNSADWPISDRIVATGDTTVQATTLEGSALSELLLTVDTEVGEGYIDGDGRYVFRNRHALIEDTRSNTSQATFGDGGGSELLYQDVAVDYDDEQLCNVVRITRVGGTAQEAEDAASQAQFLVHVYDRSDLIMESDTVASDYANYILSKCKDPELRFASLTIDPRRDPDNLFPQVLGREIGDRITVKLRPPGGGATIERDVHIRGIEHTATPDTWLTVWTLQDASTEAFLILNHATYGQLNENVLAF